MTLSSRAQGWLAAGPDPFSASGEVHGLRTVAAAVLALLRAEARGEVRRIDVDEALLHTLLSLDAPRPDRVHLRARLGDRELSMRDAAAWMTTTKWPKRQNVCAIGRVETRAEGFFDVEPAEAFARVVSTYRVNWSNFMPYAPAVRAHFMSDPPAEQQAFLRAFLQLYDDNTDVTHQPGAHAAATFLRERRRYQAWHTVVLDDATPGALTPMAVCEAALHDAHAAYIGALLSTQQALIVEQPAARYWLAHRLEAAQTLSLEAKDGVFAEVLRALLVPAPLVSALSLADAAAAVTADRAHLEHLPPSTVMTEAMPALVSTHAALARAADAVLRCGC